MELPYTYGNVIYTTPRRTGCGNQGEFNAEFSGITREEFK